MKESFDRLNAFSIYHSIATAPERDAANKNCTDALLEALAQEKEKQKEEDSDVQVLSEEGPDVKKPDEPPKEDPRKSFKVRLNIVV